MSPSPCSEAPEGPSPALEALPELSRPRVLNRALAWEGLAQALGFSSFWLQLSGC